MGFAAAGLIPPAAGALLQEGIDVAAILNALRVLGWQPPRPGRAVRPEVFAALLEGHRELAAVAAELRTLAMELDALPPGSLAERAAAAVRRLEATVVPHERLEERDVYPALAAALPGPDPLAAHSRTQAELFRLVRQLERLAADLGAGEGALDPEDIADLRQLLIGIATLLRLNLAQEEDLAALLGWEGAETGAPAPAGAPAR
jgi:hypothetical protein